MRDLVFSATAWPSNADLIADVARLGYLQKHYTTLDPTYGKGNWWKKWSPDYLVKHDITQDGVDFRDLDYVDNLFHAIAFDPPYVAKGGRETSGIKEMDSRYGMGEAPATPQLLQELINDGLTEMRRVLAPGGVLLVKCQKYISSGKLWNGVQKTLVHAESLGLVQVDEFLRVGSSRLQPTRTRMDGQPVRQHHSRNNYSNLIILRK